MTLRLMAVHAHPDDESSKGAGTYAHYVRAGAAVMVVSCTGGERGDIQNEALDATAMADRDMAGLRRIEMARARDIVGFEHRWLGYQDSGLPEHGEPVPANSFSVVPLEYSAAPLVRLIRDVRPQVLVTYDESGGYPHPDHIRTHELALYAVDAAADPSRYPEAGQPWRVQKLYYDRIFNSTRIHAIYDAAVAVDPDSELVGRLTEFRSWTSGAPDASTTHIPVGDELETRDAALRAHASQVAPDSPFFFLPNDLQRQAWPWEDFQLVRSDVASDLPENDLFAGIVDDDALPPSESSE